jgi:integrase
MLYETAARASEALSLNVEDLDLELDNKRVRVRSKGWRPGLAPFPDRRGAPGCGDRR